MMLADILSRDLVLAEMQAGNRWEAIDELINNLVAGGWSTAGENVGYGPSVAAIFGGLRNSSGHYNNMVNGSYTHVGVGVVVVDGVMWTTHLFAG